MSTVINSSMDEEIVKSLKISSAIAIIAGSWSLMFEIAYFHYFAIDIYIARVSFTFISLAILSLSFKKLTLKQSTFLVHLLILSMITSFVYTIYKIPNTLFINSQILSLLVFTTALIFSWEVKNQIIIAIYYNLLFASSIVFNQSKIFLLPNLFSIIIFVALISLLSVAASAVNYNRRKIFRLKSEEVNFIFNSIPIGICRTDSKGYILTCNDFIMHLFGKIDLKNRVNIIDIIPDAGFKDHFANIIFSETGVQEVSLSYFSKEKGTVYLRIISNVILPEEGKAIIDLIIKDESKEIIAINEQRESTLKLFNEIKEKEKLSQLRLTEKNQKIQLLAKINHEVRTPLNSILMFQQMIQDDILHSMQEVKKYSKSVKTSVGHLLNTINNFIDYAKIETGNLEIERDLFNVNEEIEDVLQLLKPLAVAKSIHLLLKNIKSFSVLAYSDSKKYRQIVTNLIANSIKFTKEGSIVVILNNRHIESDRYEIITTIEDTGIGIDNDKLKDIFNPFVSHDENKANASSGLGLAICKEFIEMLEGKIELSSKVGHGTQITFKIPYRYNFDKVKDCNSKL